jgi:translation elongation factor EF-Tu-like GTPase
MDAGLPGVEFETHGRIASAADNQDMGITISRSNHPIQTQNRQISTQNAPLHSEA